MSKKTTATKEKKTKTEDDSSSKMEKKIEDILRLLSSISRKIDNMQMIGGTHEKKQKKIKDPNAPRKNKNAYMFFCNKNRDEIQKANPDKVGKDLVKFMSEKWNKLNEKDKEQYNKFAEEDKKRYDVELKKYKESLTTSTSTSTPNKK